ncbi:MAG: hypothetical protein ACM3ME_09210 [Chloroflexota bacterium]
MTSEEIFTSEAKEVILNYPKLTIGVSSNGTPIVLGKIDIIDSNDEFWESYDIEIHPSELYPARFPILFETSNKFPHNSEWHVNEGDDSCCVDVIQNEIIECNKGITFLNYMKSYVLPYFFNQTHRKKTGYYVNGEYSHGHEGSIEYYKNALGINDQLILFEILKLLYSDVDPDRRSKCFCGKDKKYRKCHREAFNSLKVIPKDILLKHINFLYKQLPGLK